MPPKVELKGKNPQKKPSNPAEAFITGNIAPVESEAEKQTVTNDKKSDAVVTEVKNIKIDTEEKASARRGRPPKTTEKKKQYSISIKPSLYDKAKDLALEKEISVNEVISEALIKYLK